MKIQTANYMTKADKIHLFVISMINLAIIFKLISIAWSGNDKAIILIVLGYPVLIIINGLIWLVLKIIKKQQSKIYKIGTIGLVVLLVPTILISMMY